MPIYEYQCTACEKVFTALLTISGRDEAERDLRCPDCDGSDPKRLLSGFSVGCGSGGGGRARQGQPPCASGGG